MQLPSSGASVASTIGLSRGLGMYPAFTFLPKPTGRSRVFYSFYLDGAGSAALPMSDHMPGVHTNGAHISLDAGRSPLFGWSVASWGYLYGDSPLYLFGAGEHRLSHNSVKI